MNRSVLLVGGGGREHALAWKLRQSPQVGTIFCIPGNPGIANIAECIDHGIKTADDFSWLADFAAEHQIALTVVGPEAPLIGNHVSIVDVFNSRGRKIFGPPRAGALIEGDRAFCMKLLQKYEVPIPEFAVFEDRQAAKDYVHSHPLPAVIKPNWAKAAAGKGVTIAQTCRLANFAIDEIFLEGKHGGPPVVIQKFLPGPELSAITVTDGKDILPSQLVRDFKHVSKTDRRMTGGLFSYCPVKEITESLHHEIDFIILRRTVSALAAELIPYSGALYAGLVLTSEGPKVIEFNCRFGDPETQAMLRRFDGNFFELLMAAADGRLGSFTNYRWLSDTAVCKVMASYGYPDETITAGRTITGTERAELMDRVVVFQAGTAMKDGRLVTSGGRVLGVTALGPNFDVAFDRANRASRVIHFDGAWSREDIGKEEKE